VQASHSSKDPISTIQLKQGKPAKTRSSNRSQSLSDIKQSLTDEETKNSNSYYLGNVNHQMSTGPNQHLSYSNFGGSHQSMLPYSNQSQILATMKTGSGMGATQ